MSLVTIVPAAVLMQAERTRRRQRTSTVQEAAESELTVPRARAA